MLVVLSLACLVIIVNGSQSCEADYERDHAPSIAIDCGTVSGRVVSAAGGARINTYRNIPYAVPPINELRWRPSSLLKDGWKGELDGTTLDYVQCLNISASHFMANAGTVPGVEDCLVLSVRVPAAPATKPRPVIVWIHGGGLFLGFGENPGYTTDADFTESMDAVTVSVNYRLGVMGFAPVDEFTSDGNYGNYGFSDMITALHWVQEHIASFGGDPNSVTIMGESGGATAVLGLVSSPLANNLFHNAISLSPAPVWNTSYSDANELYKSWLDNANCTQDTKEQRLACMQSLDINKVSETALPMFSKPYSDFYFDFPLTFDKFGSERFGFALIDPVIVPQPPSDLIHAEFAPRSKVRLILSNTAEECGAISLPPHFINVFPNTTQGWELLNQTLIDRTITIKGDTAAALIAEMWSVYPEFNSPQQAWDTITTDIRGTCPINDLAQDMAQSEHHDVYRMYIKHHVPGLPSYHGYDTAAIFGYKYDFFGLFPDFIQSHMKQFKDEITSVVKDFVYGGAEWEVFPTNSRVLTNEAPWSEVVSERVQGPQCEFWRKNDMLKYGWQN